MKPRHTLLLHQKTQQLYDDSARNSYVMQLLYAIKPRSWLADFNQRSYRLSLFGHVALISVTLEKHELFRMLYDLIKQRDWFWLMDATCTQSMWLKRDRSRKRNRPGRKMSDRVCERMMERERSEEPGSWSRYGEVSGLNCPNKFRSNVMLLKLRNAPQSLFYPMSKIN